ncbi:hypothetical protein G9A89_008948 [Geosiphon pyriformis]|nr:hypothetical protein G9A89_008948 [Geosiphon pyriformis]
MTDDLFLKRLDTAAYYASLAYCLTDSEDDRVSETIYAKAQIIKNDFKEHDIVMYIHGVGYNDAKAWKDREFKLIKHPKLDMKIDAIFWEQWSLAHEAIDSKIIRAIIEFSRVSRSIKGFSLVGHGLGAVHALLTALSWSQSSFAVRYAIQVYLFGIPRIGDQKFASAINSLTAKNIQVQRINYLDDYVPRIPLKLSNPPLVHPTKEFWISSDCACNGKPEVYWCFGTIWPDGYIGESQECINSQTSLMSTAHNGPYFGNFMNDCSAALNRMNTFMQN